MAEPRRAFVCGHPVKHSRSPLIHGTWLAEHGLSGSYERIDKTPGEVAAFLREFGELGFVGGNVTIPHKEAALAACDTIDETAQLIGAVNTVWTDSGKLCGTNTDAYGFAANLDERAPGWDEARHALVLGAGGAARAVIYALRNRGIADIRIVNRTLTRAIELRDRFDGESTAHGLDALTELLVDTDLLVNATSLGMDGEDGDLPSIHLLPSHALVTDIVYVPLLPPLLVAASARGLKTADGIGMLLHQAVPGFERWFGVRPEVTPALRAKIVADLAG